MQMVNQTGSNNSLSNDMLLLYTRLKKSLKLAPPLMFFLNIYNLLIDQIMQYVNQILSNDDQMIDKVEIIETCQKVD